MTDRRCLPSLARLAAFMAAGLCAQPAPPPDDVALVAALEAEIAALSALSWVPTASAATSFGWRDNVLLSAFAPIGRAFGRGELEALLFRPRRNHWEFITILNGDVLRYVSAPPETAGEQQWAMHTEFRWIPVDPIRLALKAVGYWQDTVSDLSETEVMRLVTPTRVRGGLVACAPRFTLPAGWHVEPAVQVRRNDYRDYGGDHDDAKGGVRLGWRSSAALVLSAAWFELRRTYDQRTNYTAGGRPLPGTHLRFRQREGELKVHVSWGRDGAWSLDATVARLENGDRASGYFDYTQKRASLELEWQRAPWRTIAWIEGGRTVYRTQTVGAGIAPPARLAEDFETVLRVERTLAPPWSVFAEYRWERSRSNQADLGYRVNTALAGVQREF